MTTTIPSISPGLAPGTSQWGGPYGFKPEPVPVEHDPDRVRVAAADGSAEGRTTIVSPFTGKREIWPIYLQSLRRLPTDHCHGVFYDNSGDRGFQSVLLETLKQRFRSYTLVEDLNPALVVDNVNTDWQDRWRLISARCSRVYREIYENHVPESAPHVVNLEDDVEIPRNAFDRMIRLMNESERVGTVVGMCRDRRQACESESLPIAFNFEATVHIGSTMGPLNVELVQLPERQFGVEPIGAAHMGLWMTRREALRDCPMGEANLHGIIGHDLVWGWRLNEAGYYFAHDWSVRCKHWDYREGKLISV